MSQQIDDYNTYELPAGNSAYLKIEREGTKIRLCSKALELILHNTTAAGKYTTTPCSGDGCELCEKGTPMVFKYAYLVLKRPENTVIIFEAPLTVFREIRKYAINPEYGDPQKYDLTISKEGEGKNTTYSVIASPKQSELTDKELEILGNSKVSLEEAYKDKS